MYYVTFVLYSHIPQSHNNFLGERAHKWKMFMKPWPKIGIIMTPHDIINLSPTSVNKVLSEHNSAQSLLSVDSTSESLCSIIPEIHLEKLNQRDLNSSAAVPGRQTTEL